jgi:uncharacterized protein YbjT (DUF2867 family)
MDLGLYVMETPLIRAHSGRTAHHHEELDQMITVMGATGNTGRKITTRLLDAGEAVRALGRSPERLAELEALGAETVAGDVRDAAHLASAFAGADAAYTLTAFDPTLPDYHADQDRRGEAIASAIRASGVRHVVALSALGAELAGGNGSSRACTGRSSGCARSTA